MALKPDVLSLNFTALPVYKIAYHAPVCLLLKGQLARHGGKDNPFQQFCKHTARKSAFYIRAEILPKSSLVYCILLFGYTPKAV